MTTIYNQKKLCDICLNEEKEVIADSSCHFCNNDICEKHNKSFSTHNPFLIKFYEISYKRKRVFCLCPNCFNLFKEKINDVIMKEFNLKQKYISKMGNDFKELKNETDELWENLLEKLDIL